MTPWFTMEISADSGMVEWTTSLTPQFVLYLNLQRPIAKHIQTSANPRGTVQIAVSQLYLHYSEMWRFWAMGIANFVTFTTVLHVPVHKEIFPTVE